MSSSLAFSNQSIERKMRSSSLGNVAQIMDLLRDSCYSTKKSSAIVKIE